MADNRIVFHFNKAHNADKTIPPWVVKHRGQTHYVHHFTSEVGFTTKETPDSEHTKASIQLRGRLEIIKHENETHAKITEVRHDGFGNEVDG
jgi:hypothetical protein